MGTQLFAVDAIEAKIFERAGEGSGEAGKGRDWSEVIKPPRKRAVISRLLWPPGQEATYRGQPTRHHLGRADGERKVAQGVPVYTNKRRVRRQTATPHQVVSGFTCPPLAREPASSP